MPDQPMRADGSKRLTVLTEAERLALYGLPDFDDFQRAEFFALSPSERALVDRRKGLAEQVWCLLQIGYFKAKQAFFRFSWPDVPAKDIAFLMERYFPGSALTPQPIRANEHYAQRREIAGVFNYRLWAEADRLEVVGKAGLLARRDVSVTFILTELLAFLAARRIVRPGHTTLQGIISEVLTAERQRLEQLVEDGLDQEALAALQSLLVREDTLSELAALKQDAKHFGYRMMALERQKRVTLAPLYRLAKTLLPRLDISQQNVAYYASLAHYYTIYDLRRLKPGQTYLYLLCYAWQRFRQLTDNLVEAFGFHMGQLERQTKEESEAAFAQTQAGRQQEAPRIGRVLLLYVDDTVDDATPFGAVRHRAFAILPREALLGAGRRLCEKPVSQLDLRWQAVDRAAARYKRHLRPLAMALDVSAVTAASPWLAALAWMKGLFSRQQSLAQSPLGEIPDNTIPERLRPHLLEGDEDGKPTGLRGDRYEFWIYRQLRKRLATGELYLDDSVRHRRFGDDLVASDRAAVALRDLDSPWVHQPVDATLDGLCTDLHRLWLTFDRDLRQGKLKHLDYDAERKTLSWRNPGIDKEDALQAAFYAKLPARGIADVFRFVNERCRFLAALTPLQPRYAKKIADDDSLMAVILGQAMNHGNLGMAETSDIAYHVLEATHQQHLRLSTLKAANDRVSNFIASLGIFPFYSFDPAVLYGSVDGQKFAVAVPTAKARHSRKYFGTGKGVVAYTLLANHVPLETELIGAHEHESHYVFDLCYHNTSDIAPTTITGDMHSINRANFAILHWFGMRLAPRFTRRQAQLKHLYCGNPIEDYQDCLVQPAGRIDRELIIAEKANIDRIIATLGLKEMSQATLVRKLCALSPQDRTRKAIFEFDKLVRSLYTLDYLRDPQLQRDVHRSQNRLEAYHQLRAALSQVSGAKQLIGRTDLAVAISNQCGRLVANVVIAYNSILLSTLLERYRGEDNRKALALLQKISPVAWRHIHLLGHYTFRGGKHAIDPEALLANVRLG